jgi:hypothetical protein
MAPTSKIKQEHLKGHKNQIKRVWKTRNACKVMIQTSKSFASAACIKRNKVQKKSKHETMKMLSLLHVNRCRKIRSPPKAAQRGAASGEPLCNAKALHSSFA